MTTLTFYEDYSNYTNEAIDMKPHHQMNALAVVFREFNNTTVTQLHGDVIATIADAYYMAVTSMNGMLLKAYTKNPINNVNQDESESESDSERDIRGSKSMRLNMRYNKAAIRLFVELNETRLKCRMLLIRATQDPMIQKIIDRYNAGELKSRRVQLVSQCLRHINTTTWDYNIVITAATDLEDLYQDYLGWRYYGKRVPDDIGRAVDECFCGVMPSQASP